MTVHLVKDPLAESGKEDSCHRCMTWICIWSRPCQAAVANFSGTLERLRNNAHLKQLANMAVHLVRCVLTEDSSTEGSIAPVAAIFTPQLPE